MDKNLSTFKYFISSGSIMRVAEDGSRAEILDKESFTWAEISPSDVSGTEISEKDLGPLLRIPDRNSQISFSKI